MLRILGARINGFRPELVLACGIVSDVFAKFGLDAVLRYGIEGKHSRGSEHYTGLGADFRIHHVALHLREDLVGIIREALGPDFDVIHEGIKTAEEHIHIEFDPKEPY